MARKKTKKEYSAEEYAKLMQTVKLCIEQGRAKNEFHEALRNVFIYLVDIGTLDESTLIEFESSLNDSKSLDNIKKELDRTNYPVDKLDSVIWNQTRKSEINGQYSLSTYEKLGFDPEALDDRSEVLAVKTGKEDNINVMFALQFDEATITKQLTDYDEWVYIALGTLFHYGQRTISLDQIYRQMGGISKPSTQIKKKIAESVEKMRTASIIIDNTNEVEAKYKYSRYEYKGYLLPVETITERDSKTQQIKTQQINILKEPPLIQFARERKQIESIPVKVLQVPLSMTERHCSLQNYLIDHIAHLKNRNAKTNPVIKMSTIFKKVGIEGRKEKSRARESITTILQHYKDTDFIKDFTVGYQEDQDNVFISI